MYLNIFNVGHGFCAYLRTDAQTGILFDCGHDDEVGFRPSRFFPSRGIQNIEKFVLGNYDHDHVSDLPNLLSVANVETFTRNRSIDVAQLRTLKLGSGPLTNGLRTMLTLHETYVHPVREVDFGGVELTVFHNNYPSFSDTNNLSVVSFISFDGLGIMIPGDLECAGWESLLELESFRAALQKTSLFVGSHHGREGGYCEEVFSYCKPQVVIISDGPVQYDSQKDLYRKHAAGLPWNVGCPDQTTRYVLTTRCDGHLTISKQPGRPYFINASQVL